MSDEKRGIKMGGDLERIINLLSKVSCLIIDGKTIYQYNPLSVESRDEPFCEKSADNNIEPIQKNGGICRGV